MKKKPDMENVVPLGGRRDADERRDDARNAMDGEVAATRQMTRLRSYVAMKYVDDVDAGIYLIDTLVRCVRDHLRGRGQDGRKRAMALLDVLAEKAALTAERHGLNAEWNKELIAKHFEGKV